MDRETLAASIDHTVLGPTTTFDNVLTVLDEALAHGMNACVPPCYAAEAADYAPNVTLVTVVGFPHGQHAAEAKTAEAELAWVDGADELDVVANVGRLRAGEDNTVRDELEQVVASVPVPVKVIVEAPLLTADELRRACETARDAGAAMVKTATGFTQGGAVVEDVALMSDYLPVKASGGVDTYEAAAAMFDAGAERVGASSGVAILEGHPDGA